MTYRIRVIPEAKQEIKKAKEWYESKSLGLGDRFTAETKQAIRSLSSPHLDHKPVFTSHRRMLLPIFPYTIYYKRDEKNLVVRIVAVLHNRQSIDILESRI